MKHKELTTEIPDSDSESNSNSEEEEEEEKDLSKIVVTKEFKEAVLKFIKLDDLIKKKQEEISELKKQRAPCEKSILSFLDKNDENVIDITDGKLRKNKSTTKQRLTEDIIKSAISQYEKDPKIVEEILKTMESKRPDVTHVNLKRTAKRAPKKTKQKS